MSDLVEVAIVGAGPYGLSLATHLKAHQIPYRIFGHVMELWRTHMPEGMWLKSDGWASNLYDPDGQMTLARFCADRNIRYGQGYPVRLDTFCAYGLDFQRRLVPDLTEAQVTDIKCDGQLFALTLDNGQAIVARRVVVAVGVQPFAYIPETLARLPRELCSHSSDHHKLDGFKGRDVVVVGAGASAIDLAGLLHAVGARVRLATRSPALKFSAYPAPGQSRALWEQIKHPDSGLGPGWRSRFYCDAPDAFHFFPSELRRTIVRKALGPAASGVMKDMVLGKVEVIAGHALIDSEACGHQVRLRLRSPDGATRDIAADHVIAGTGYRVDLRRLSFLSPDLRSRLDAIADSPVLALDMQSSVPGMYFMGPAAANSFGPLMRFAFGAKFTARRVSRAIARSASRGI